jgi:hypothetical protein
MEPTEWSQQPKRWMVERTFAWLLRSRRVAVDDERKVQTSETFMELAMIRLLLARLGRRIERCPKHDGRARHAAALPTERPISQAHQVARAFEKMCDVFVVA